MEIVLLEKVHRLGNLGDKVKVRAGYGRNFLIPNGKAVPATAANLARLEAMRADLIKAQTKTLEDAQAKAAALADKTVTITRKAGSEGRLYGSVGTVDVAEAITAAGVAVAKKEVRLPTGPLRDTGEYTIEIHLHPDVNANVKLVIVAE
jgi:large subunit ribosomal protein L9